MMKSEIVHILHLTYLTSWQECMVWLMRNFLALMSLGIALLPQLILYTSLVCLSGHYFLASWQQLLECLHSNKDESDSCTFFLSTDI